MRARARAQPPDPGRGSAESSSPIQLSPEDLLQQANGVDWTAVPNTLLVSNRAQLAGLSRRTRTNVAALVASKERDFGLVLRLGDEVERLSGHRGFCFFQQLPDAGAQVLLLCALCPLRELTLADGGRSVTGAFIDSYRAKQKCDLTRHLAFKHDIGVECIPAPCLNAATVPRRRAT